MINKELIELQRSCKATCVVIQNEDSNELDSKVVINSNLSDEELINVLRSNTEELRYLVITKIDEINADAQDKFYHIVKDREFRGYKLPEDIIIVLTVKNNENLKNIKQELHNFCVVAF